MTKLSTIHIYRHDEGIACDVRDINPGDYFISDYDYFAYSKKYFSHSTYWDEAPLFTAHKHMGLLCVGKDFLEEGAIDQKGYIGSMYRRRSVEEIERMSTILQVVSCGGNIGWVRGYLSHHDLKGIFLLQAGSYTRHLRNPSNPNNRVHFLGGLCYYR